MKRFEAVPFQPIARHAVLN